MPNNKDMKGSRKRKKNYYVNYQKRPRFNTLEPGLKGFLLTCNHDEKRCIREAYNILNEFSSKDLLPDQEVEKTKEMDIESDLEHELAELKTTTSEGKPFQQLYTGVKSCLFIQSKLEEPCQLVQKILQDIQKHKTQRTVSTQKIYPVLTTCKANLDSVRKGLEEVLDYILQHQEVYCTNSKLQYSVLFKARHNDSLTKDSIVTTIIDMVRSKGIDWEPEPRTPDCAISIDILCTICCISVLPNFKTFKRYNLLEISKVDQVVEEEKGEGVGGEASNGDEERVKKVLATGVDEDKNSKLDSDTAKDTCTGSEVTVKVTDSVSQDKEDLTIQQEEGNSAVK